MNIIFQTEHSFSERLYLSKFKIKSDEFNLAQPGRYGQLNDKARKSGPYSLILDKEHPNFLWICSRKKMIFSFDDIVNIDSTHGQMIAADKKKYICCAAGTGVTPFLSLLKSTNQEFKCFWMLSDLRDLLILEYFGLRKDFQLFEYDKDIVLIKKSLKEYIPMHDVMFYLAGSYNFVTRVGDWLLKEGVIPERIISDMKKFY